MSNITAIDLKTIIQQTDWLIIFIPNEVSGREMKGMETVEPLGFNIL
jgi:hypothetical protein